MTLQSQVPQQHVHVRKRIEHEVGIPRPKPGGIPPFPELAVQDCLPLDIVCERGLGVLTLARGLVIKRQFVVEVGGEPEGLELGARGCADRLDHAVERDGSVLDEGGWNHEPIQPVWPVQRCLGLFGFQRFVMGVDIRL